MRVHHLAFRTHDVEALASFYEQILGLARVREQAGYSVWLRLGEAVLMLERAEPGESSIPLGSREFVAFAVDASERSRLQQRLEDHGVEIEETGVYTNYFRDPDGRRVGLSTYPLPELQA